MFFLPGCLDGKTQFNNAQETYNLMVTYLICQWLSTICYESIAGISTLGIQGCLVDGVIV